MDTTHADGSSPTITQRDEAARQAFRLDGSPPPNRRKKKKAPGETPNQKAARKRREKQDAANTSFVNVMPISPAEANFRHAHWADKRRRVRIALIQAGTTENVLNQFDNCGSDCTVEFDKETKRYRLRASYCKNRNCEPCMKAKANLLAANLQQIVKDKPNGQFRFITLTLKHSHEPLAVQIDRLTACFKRLRNTKVWKETQTGGAAIFECKYNRDTGEWHPHYHIVAEGFFLHHRDLSEEWYAITGDSFRVDIRTINSAKDAAYYVAKYTSKGTNDDVWHTPHAAVEWITAMRGRRGCLTYGTWRHLKLLARLPDTGTWTTIGSLNSIDYAASQGEQWAISCMDAIKRDLQYNPHRARKTKSPPLPIVSS